MVVSCCPALQHLHLDLYQLPQDWIIYFLELAWKQAHWTTLGKPRESQYTDQRRKCPSKQKLSGYSGCCKTTCSQDRHKQRAHFTKLPWRFWGYWILSRSPISHPDRSKYYPKETPCRPIPVHLKKHFPTRNWQDAQSGSSEASTWGHPMDQQFCTCWGEGQAWKFEIGNLLGPHQSKQSNIEGTIPLQNTGGHCSFACRCLFMYVCNCKKGYWYQELDEASPFLTILTLSLGDLDIPWCILELLWQKMCSRTSWTNALGTCWMWL